MTQSNGIICGVCNRIAGYFGINIILVRVVWILLTIITFIIPGLFVYIILCLTGQPRIEQKLK
jgi:phage shock protein PspC (stress-responsive transcriptional regulator)